MPEGDTIFRTARTLRTALEGQPVTGVATRVGAIKALGPARLIGQSVAQVESRGKHLLIWFSPSDVALHTHMRMSGSWHLYGHGERWRKPEHLARFRLDVPEWTAVCFSAPVCALLSRKQVTQRLAALGPDVLDDRVDLTEARRRLDGCGDVAIAEALLDQRVVAGIGNVYKCELLFLHRVNPWTPVSAVAPRTRDALLASAQRLLKRNVAPGAVARTTTAEGPSPSRLHVYGRARRPCPRCATPLRRARQGELARSTYWCPRCQPSDGPQE